MAASTMDALRATSSDYPVFHGYVNGPAALYFRAFATDGKRRSYQPFR